MLDFLLSLPEFWRNVIGIGVVMILVAMPLVNLLCRDYKK